MKINARTQNYLNAAPPAPEANPTEEKGGAQIIEVGANPGDPNQPGEVVVIEMGSIEDLMGAMMESMEAMMGPPPPETPLQKTLSGLKDAGLEPPDLEDIRIEGSMAAGYESLVPFKDGEGKIVASFKTQEELDNFAALVTGAAVDPGLKQVSDELKALDSRGEQLYLKRGGNYLRTTPEAAAIAVNRGDAVVRSDLDGNLSSVSNAQAVTDAVGQNPGGTPTNDTIKLMNQAEKVGMDFAVFDPDAGTNMDISLSNVLSMMRQEVKPFAEAKVELAEALDSGKRVNVSFSEEHRPIPLPSPLTRTQLEAAIAYETAPTPQMVEYREAFKALLEDDAVIMAREEAGGAKGMVVRADSRRALLNLVAGSDVVVLTKDGNLHKLTQVADMADLQKNGKVSSGGQVSRWDNSQPSDNLFMYYHVSPFDPIEKGNYEDAPLRLTEIGSSKELDIVQMRSDLPTKRNLLTERVQKGELEQIERLAPETVMSDPKVLEDFVYKTVKANIDDKHIRLLVGGHGGAEKGLLPDGEHNNAAADSAMPVDDFAQAIARGLERVEQETGVSREIDNLILCSCLMGNTSFINALADTGRVKYLTASPELMMGSNPSKVFEFLADPANSDTSAEDYARKLVDIVSDAPSMPGGHESMQHASTYGAYDLSPQKAKNFQQKLDGFFKACLAEPEYAEYIKEDIAHCPTYGINKYLNAMFDVDGRDLYQVLERIEGDARIKSDGIKKAITELKAATLDQVLDQKVDEGYEGRRGPSLYLPVDGFDFEEKLANTELLKNIDYQPFMEMIFDQKLQRGLIDSVLLEVNKSTERAKEEEGGSLFANGAPGVDPMEEFEAKEGDAMGGIFGQLMKRNKDSQENQAIKALEEKSEGTPIKDGLRTLKKWIKGAALVAGGVAGFAIGAVPGAVVGALSGMRAGFTGTSISGTAKPQQESDPSTARVVIQGLGALAEEPAINLHKKLTYNQGEFVGRVLSAAAGIVTGAVGGAVAGGGIGGLLVGGLARGVVSIPLALIPTKEEKKNHPEDMMMGFPFPMGFGLLNEAAADLTAV